MITIQNLQPDPPGWTCGADIDGQLIEGIRIGEFDHRPNMILPASARDIDWGEHTIADLKAAATAAVNAESGWTLITH